MKPRRSVLSLLDPTAHEILTEEREIQKRLARASQEPGEPGFEMRSSAPKEPTSKTMAGRSPERR
jgi:hypothetical protein